MNKVKNKEMELLLFMVLTLFTYNVLVSGQEQSVVADYELLDWKSDTSTRQHVSSTEIFFSFIHFE